ncbi:Arm DNA-binding domain-containing protein [Novosphingobium gossypii]|uniref:Arm DNA-binding domain-containing protein n=1 Tax=Novosphingobium gossypii TaxID=1604774 RepID=UPI003D1F7F41
MLTTIQINALKPREKDYKVADGKGLYLLVKPNGSLLWRVKFRFHGIEKKMALGRYPDVGLKEARDKRDEAREQLESGIDPDLPPGSPSIITRVQRLNTMARTPAQARRA